MYFINGTRIEKSDFYVMSKLQAWCSIIPILAKGDSYTVEEVKTFKQTVMEEAAKWHIEWFNFKEVFFSQFDGLLNCC